MSWMKNTLLSSMLLTTYVGFAADSSVHQECCACNRFVRVAQECIPSVVFIRTEFVDTEDLSPFGMHPGLPPGFPGFPGFPGIPNDQFGDEMFQKFFGVRPGGPQKQAPKSSQGSGFIVSADGYIMTNNHVVQKAEKITVIFHDEREMEATVIGTDPRTDLAILKVDAQDLPFLTFGDSDALQVGEDVAAIGSPFQLQASITTGVISAKGRQNLQITDFDDLIQTDAAINPGNSGGPLINLDCQVVGINTAMIAQSMGLGFSIPSNLAVSIMNKIIDSGSVTRGFLGVSIQPVDKEIAAAFSLDKAEGALISEVLKNSPAENAGIKQGDIIVECNGVPVRSATTFRKDISLMNPNTTVVLKINRKGSIITLPVTLGSSSDAVVNSNDSMQKLGMEVEALTGDLRNQLGYAKDEEGVVITKVKPGSPAAQVGLRPGFLIQAINHKKVTTVQEFYEALSESATSKRVLILVKHGAISRFYSIKLP